MKVAIPVFEGRLCLHFGMATQFAFVDADADKKEVLGVETLDAPEHEPGVLPKWLAEQGAELVIVAGMGQRAQQLFAAAGIQLVVGAPEETPENLVLAYLNGTLTTGQNICQH